MRKFAELQDENIYQIFSTKSGNILHSQYNALTRLKEFKQMFKVQN